MNFLFLPFQKSIAILYSLGNLLIEFSALLDQPNFQTFMWPDASKSFRSLLMHSDSFFLVRLAFTGDRTRLLPHDASLFGASQVTVIWLVIFLVSFVVSCSVSWCFDQIISFLILIRLFARFCSFFMTRSHDWLCVFH
jgi:hypothetical protein